MDQTLSVEGQVEELSLRISPPKIKSRDGLLGKRITELKYIPRGGECQ
jgi:hypothetical protein